MLDELIIDAIYRGKINLINSLMAGFDVIAAESVIRMKSRFPQIRLFSIAPFHDKYFHNWNWSLDWIRRAMEVCNATDYDMSLTKQYTAGVYYDCIMTVTDGW